MGEDEKELLEEIKGNQLFMPAGEDSPSTKVVTNQTKSNPNLALTVSSQVELHVVEFCLR